MSGLPDDVKEREIHNLFRLLAGYEGCKMAVMNQRQVSFASFRSRENAAHAIQLFNGILFEPSSSVPLKIEFARSNSKVKRLITGEVEGGGSVEKRRKVGTQSPPHIGGLALGLSSGSSGSNGGMSSYSPLQQQIMIHQHQGFGYGGYGNSYDTQYGGYFETYVPHVIHGIHSSPISSHSRLTPCTTLFVTGIDPSLSELELISYFSATPGFQRFRMGKDGLNCFLDFCDLHTSSLALNTLNNSQMGNFKLRVDYAKKKMGDGTRFELPQTNTNDSSMVITNNNISG